MDPESEQRPSEHPQADLVDECRVSQAVTEDDDLTEVASMVGLGVRAYLRRRLEAGQEAILRVPPVAASSLMGLEVRASRRRRLEDCDGVMLRAPPSSSEASGSMGLGPRALMRRMTETGDGAVLLPASKATIEALPVLELTGEKTTDNCSVCLEMLGSSSVTEMPCRHVFHSGCIGEWLEIQGTCPLCKSSLPLAESEVRQFFGL